jgi:hypothetical protein
LSKQGKAEPNPKAIPLDRETMDLHVCPLDLFNNLKLEQRLVFRREFEPKDISHLNPYSFWLWLQPFLENDFVVIDEKCGLELAIVEGSRISCNAGILNKGKDAVLDGFIDVLRDAAHLVVFYLEDDAVS